MKNGKILFSFILLALLFLSVTSYVRSQTCSDANSCNSLIDQYTNQIKTLQGQSNTLKNQIAQFDAQIKLTSLKITQTEEQISLLSGRIDQLQGSLGSLSTAFEERAVETYKMARIGDPFILLVSADNLNEAFDRYSYLKKIQEGDRSLIQRLQTAQDNYEEEKTDQEDLQKKLAEQKRSLDSQKQAKNTLLSQTKNDESKYQKLLAAAKSQLDSFKQFTQSQGGSVILPGQTKCDSWGCYYNQRDTQWGNMYMGGTNYTMKDSGCFVTSVAMIASHFRKNVKPNDIAAIPAVFTSQGDLKWEPFNVNGVGISISSASKNDLDQRLNTGAVIAGLDTFPNSVTVPNHFIVILRKEGNNYIMHDPFLENGSNRNLTDKYNVSQIVTLRLVNFN